MIEASCNACTREGRVPSGMEVFKRKVRVLHE